MAWIQPEKHLLIIFVFIKDIGFEVLFCHALVFKKS